MRTISRPIATTVVAGLLLGALGDVARIPLAWASGIDSLRWSLFATGAWNAESAVIAIILVALARRTRSRALYVATALYGALVAWSMAHPLLAIAGGHAPWLISVFRWAFVAVIAMHVLAAIAIAIAVGGRRAAIAAGLFALSILGRVWVPQSVLAMPWVARVYSLAMIVLWTGAQAWLLLGLCRALPEEVPPERGSRRVVLLGAIALAIAALGPLVSSAAVVLVASALVTMGGLFACAIGLVVAAHATLDRWSRWRLVGGAAMALWWWGLQPEQLAATCSSIESGVTRATPWSIAGPAIAYVGLALGASASAHRLILFAVLAASSIALVLR